MKKEDTPLLKVIEGYLIYKQLVDEGILKEIGNQVIINETEAIKYLEKQNLELQQENKQLKKLLDKIYQYCEERKKQIKDDMNIQLTMYQKGELTGSLVAFEEILNLIKEE